MMITSRITCITWHCIHIQNNGDWAKTPRIARFMGQPWGPSGADRTQVVPMLAPWTLLSGTCLALKTESSWCQLCRHWWAEWWHRRLSFWQSPVPPCSNDKIVIMTSVGFQWVTRWPWWVLEGLNFYAELALTGALQWRHNGHDSVSNHQPHDCLLNRLFRRRSKKTSKLRVTGLCAGNSPGNGEFPSQMASYAENVSISWSHHGVVTHHCMFRHYGGNWPCFTRHHIITPRLHSSV